MKLITEDKTSILGFGLALLIILSASMYAIIHLRALVENYNLVSHTLMVLDKIEETLVLVTDAETGQRGYIITAEEKYLEPYYAALAPDRGISQHFRELRQLTSTNPHQQKRLDLLEPLVTEKLAFLQETINQTKDARLDAGQKALLSAKGKQMMDDIRRLLADMRSEESELLQHYREMASASLRDSILALAIGGLVSLSLLSFSFYAVKRQVGERRRVEQSVRQLNDELEQRVQQRTSELSEANKTLQSSEKRLRTTLDSMLEGCQIIGYDWHYLYVNEAVAVQGKTTKEELLGHTMMEVYPGIENTGAFVIFQRCMEERRAHRLENEFIFPDGSKGWFDLSIQPVPEGIFILSVDITERKHAEDALRQGEQKFSLMFEKAPFAAALSTLPDGRIVDINEAWEQMSGYTKLEMLGKTTLELGINLDTEARARIIAQLQARGSARDQELTLRMKSGNLRIVSVNVDLVEISGQKYILNTAQDITERKQAELRIQHLTHLYATLSQVNQTIVRVKERDELFQAICRVAVDYGKLGLAWVGWLNRETGQVTPVAVHGMAQVSLPFQSININEAPFKEGLMGSAVKTEQITYSQDIQTDPVMQHWHGTALAGGYHSVAAVPFRLNGEIVGLLNLYATNMDFFTVEEEQNLLKEMGQDISFALDTMEMETRRKQAEQSLRESEEHYRELFENNPNPMWIYDLDTLRFVAVNEIALQHYGYSREEFLAMTIADIRPPEDLPKLQANITEHSEIIQKSEGWRHKKKNGELIDVEIISHFLPEKNGLKYRLVVANDITARLRMEEEITRQLQRLRALREVDVTIMGSTNVYLSLQTVLEQVITQLSVDAANILLLNPYTQTLKYVAGRGFRSKDIEQSELRIGQGIAGRAALEQETQHIRNLASTDEEFVRTSLLAGEGFVEHYAVPLMAKGNTIGVLEIFNRQPFDPDPNWLDFLYALAGQAAIAIDNNRLFSGLQRANVDLLRAYDTTIEGWSHVLDLRDKETEGHTLRVTELTMKLARSTGIDEEKLVHVRRGALLHDIGKMGVPDHILLKPDKLTDEEWEIMRKHPVFAYEMLSPIEYLRPALDIPYCHHEKWDGTGYPRGLKGEQIPLAARLFAVVDVWDALCSDRPYRKGWSVEKVREHIKSLAGTHFDPKAVERFLTLTAEQ